MKQQTQAQIREHIKSDATVKTINTDKQERHILNSGQYIQGRSYLFDGIDAQSLVDKYHGTGNIEVSISGTWKNKETVTVDEDIGEVIDPITGERAVTNRITIHYSKTGAHVVPTGRRI